MPSQGFTLPGRISVDLVITHLLFMPQAFPVFIVIFPVAKILPIKYTARLTYETFAI